MVSTLINLVLDSDKKICLISHFSISISFSFSALRSIKKQAVPETKVQRANVNDIIAVKLYLSLLKSLFENSANSVEAAKKQIKRTVKILINRFNRFF